MLLALRRYKRALTRGRRGTRHRRCAHGSPQCHCGRSRGANTHSLLSSCVRAKHCRTWKPPANSFTAAVLYFHLQQPAGCATGWRPPVPVSAQLRLPGKAVGVGGALLNNVGHHVAAVRVNGNHVHHLQAGGRCTHPSRWARREPWTAEHIWSTTKPRRRQSKSGGSSRALLPSKWHSGLPYAPQAPLELASRPGPTFCRSGLVRLVRVTSINRVSCLTCFSL